MHQLGGEPSKVVQLKYIIDGGRWAIFLIFWEKKAISKPFVSPFAGFKAIWKN